MIELRTFIQWDEQQHELFAERLMKEGVDPCDITEADEEMRQAEATLAKPDYYKKVCSQTPVEKFIVDLSAPFSLYGGRLQLGFSERMNVLERETVQIYKKRLYQFEGIQEYLQKKYPNGLPIGEGGYFEK